METLLFTRLTHSFSLIEITRQNWINLPQSSADFAELGFCLFLLVPFFLLKYLKIFKPEDERYTMVRIFGGTGVIWIVAAIFHCSVSVLFSYGPVSTAMYVALRMYDHNFWRSMTVFNGLLFNISVFDTRLFVFSLTSQYLFLVFVLLKSLVKSFKMVWAVYQQGTLLFTASLLSLPLFYVLAPEGIFRNIGCYVIWVLSFTIVILFPPKQDLIHRYSYIEGAPY